MASLAEPRRLLSVRVLVVDDQPLFRFGLTQLFGSTGGIVVCGEAPDAAIGLRMVLMLSPDVVVVDINSGGHNGLQLLKDMRAHVPDLPVLVLSVHDESAFGERALRAGATGYLTKEASAECIIDAVRRIAIGEIVVSAQLASRMLRRVAGTPRSGRAGANTTGAGSPAQLLSDRELEIFELLGHGNTTREIAQALHISAKTVQTHRVRIKEKLGIESAHALLRAAVHWVSERKVEE